MPQLTYRPATAADAAALTVLLNRSFAHWHHDQVFKRFMRGHMTITPQYIAEGTVQIALQGSQMVGFYALTHYNARKILLDTFFIDPVYIGQGNGRAMYAAAKATAKALGYPVMVIMADPHALGFYEKMGAQLHNYWQPDKNEPLKLPVLNVAL
ncbi:GNAT family N-acetyltransferase [Schleiferilactobacillus shenzhenensis]|uniref:N-acetyltransferase domain-containing protein n=1 Tax=Schleiferilactobacillus shenzhenensis LY-73 TaxID=1231336 RepID=U4TQV7_9LACO|nr:GNAT family N-acetyltransferase [Schleiferilactobacillus shenzhenensis]ERL65820.1 hypothetical protein L248_1896 [Schleiferilactobacillus shenzhenensis LY-73]